MALSYCSDSWYAAGVIKLKLGNIPLKSPIFKLLEKEPKSYFQPIEFKGLRCSFTAGSDLSHYYISFLRMFLPDLC